MRSSLTKAGIPHCINSVGGMFGLYFIGEEVFDYETAQKCDATKYGKHFRQMLEAGVYLAPSAFEAAFMSAAHSDQDLEDTANAFRASIARL